MTSNSVRSFGILAVILGGALIAGETTAQAQEDKYAGTWNYDQPSASTGVNIATIGCPATTKGAFVLTVPQIGTLTLKRNVDGRLEGRTDQECTWTFKDGASSAELDPVQQSCFNKVIGSSYTITRWSIGLDGSHETEFVEAKSHLPMGDCDFVLKQGARTKAGDADSAGLFVGVWQYDAPNAQTHSNMLQVVQHGDNDRSAPIVAPQTGVVNFAKTGDHTLTALTADGCFWLLDVHGNTALLPTSETCEIAGSKITMNHWTIASDGDHQDSVMNMTQDTGGSIHTVLLGAGRLTKQARSTSAVGSSGQRKGGQ
jgi:hypothetical protein